MDIEVREEVQVVWAYYRRGAYVFFGSGAALIACLLLGLYFYDWSLVCGVQ